MEMSPGSGGISPPQIQHQQYMEYPEYQHYNVQIGNDEPCRKNLPDRRYNPDSPSTESDGNLQAKMGDRSSGKRRVMFEDQPRHGNLNQQDRVKKDLFSQSQSKYASGMKQTSQGYGSDSEPQSLQKYSKKPDYDHFHDESMNKLEAVLQRQRERLENLGGFSGKSSQVSHKTNENEQNLEDAYHDLEQEITNIKRNLEASQNSDGTSGYSPARINGHIL